MSSEPDVEKWDPWQPRELSQRLSEAERHWYVVGGWALDLWHRKETRTHEDIEFCCLRKDAPYFMEKLNELTFFGAQSGSLYPLDKDMPLSKKVNQFWGWDEAKNVWWVDLMIDPGTEAEWVFKRNPDIRLPRSDAISTTPDGIPFLRPAPILLFKAKHCRPKDQFDFETALPHLSQSEKQWLMGSIEKEYPQCDWITEIIAYISTSRAK
ncbi:MAG: nucleotidyltransferase domain-containing protein [Paracoccaceae bacterium]